MLVSEAIEKIRRRINDEFDTGYSDEVLINYINDAKEYLSHALITKLNPELTKNIVIDSAVVNTVPRNFVKFAGGFPVRRQGNLFHITDTTLPIVEVKYFFIPDDVLAVTDNMPFQNNDTYNMLIINLASIYALNQHEFDVNQDSALKQAIEGMIDNALGVIA